MYRLDAGGQQRGGVLVPARALGDVNQGSGEEPVLDMRAEYDAKGRLWRATDPDKGVTTSTFNDADELVTTADARGEVLWHGYDVLGRKKELRDDSATGALRTEWRYDTLYTGQTGFQGHLTQAVRYEPAGSTNAYRWQVRSFDERYQPKGVNYVIPANETGLNGTYIYTYGYSAATGAPTSISYPAAGGLVTEELTTDYDATTGMPVRLDTSLTGFAGTMATATYTAYGERSGSIYRMPGGVYTQDAVYRDEATRRITRTTVQRETVTGTLSDRNYTYDHSGGITSIEEKPQVGQADIQCFRQDLLGRLTSAWTPEAGVTCQTDPTVANLGGPAPYWHDWTFNSTASRLTETSHTAGGDTTRTYAVPTGGQGVVRPHAVTAMTTQAPGQSNVVTNYAYDAAGNTTCRPTGAAANNCGTGINSQTLGWDAEGKLATVSAGGQTVETNIYDADGTRIIRRDSTGTTLYLPGQEIRREGTVNTGTRYYSFAGNVCASRKGSSATTDLTWLYDDHQGTQQIAVNAGTQAVTIRRQTPYGAPRGSNPTWVNNKGFVGGDIDPTGLTNVGARQYDQILGRFISVDPVLKADDPDQYNAYQYGGNNPVDNADPTGLYFTENSEDTGDRAYVTTSSTGEKKTKIVKKYVPPACGYVCQQQREEFRQASNERAEAARKQRAEAARKQRECQASFWCRTKDAASGVASDTLDWAKDNADIVGLGATILVTVGCSALTLGVGSVGCALIGGAVGGGLTAGLKGGGVGDVLLGAGTGALFGAVGGVAGKAAGTGLARGAMNLRGGAGKAIDESWKGVKDVFGELAPRAQIGVFTREGFRGVAQARSALRTMAPTKQGFWAKNARDNFPGAVGAGIVSTALPSSFTELGGANGGINAFLTGLV
ncbi:RHS repeat-associated core domain-containing protein [Micromonospora pallida]|uniref:RHS repeat-associated core domain-containing protein n=1 Tax=Micromonospora pallida TaxID=145854 RepID=A0A1C6RRT9_9ACTN|nr:RHS repeat-associated core domain-containing protein [Micromonospora pallida]SCL19897.1 RHS repeat-associated core domain-containing protein [Micromonospora pallida]